MFLEEVLEVFVVHFTEVGLVFEVGEDSCSGCEGEEGACFGTDSVDAGVFGLFRDEASFFEGGESGELGVSLWDGVYLLGVTVGSEASVQVFPSEYASFTEEFAGGYPDGVSWGLFAVVLFVTHRRIGGVWGAFRWVGECIQLPTGRLTTSGRCRRRW